MTDKKRILICPLDWGLGHASRDSKIIKYLSGRGHEILIGGSGRSMALLKAEFPDFKQIHLPPLNIRYDRKIPAWLMILALAPRLVLNILREHRVLKMIIRQEKVDVIISDARYGLWNSSTPSILITHQLAIKLPVKNRLLERILLTINRKAIRKFTACWIPDYKDFPNLSGVLSHIPVIPPNARFTGPISRFDEAKHFTGKEPEYEIIAIVSGPEPQRSVFEEMLTRQLSGFNRKSLIICGRPGAVESIKVSEHFTSVSFVTGNELATIMLSARHIICRSGYSSIMDLVALKKTAFLVPTPGQTEQEYLADYLSEKDMFPSCSQADFKLENAITVLENFRPQLPDPDPDLLESAILELEKLVKISKST